MFQKAYKLLSNQSSGFIFLSVSLLIFIYQKLGLVVFLVAILAFLVGASAIYKDRHYFVYTFIILCCAASVIVHSHNLSNETNLCEIKGNQKISGKVLKVTNSGILIATNIGRVFLKLEQLDRLLLQLSSHISADEIERLTLLKKRLSMYASLKKNCYVEFIVKRIYRRGGAERLIENPWYVSGRLFNVEEPRGNNFAEAKLLRIQESIRNTIFKWLGRTYGSILLGLLAGEKPYSELQILTAFERTGTMHILAVSGLHIGILYWLLRTILRPFIEAFPVYSEILCLFFLMIFIAAIGVPSSGVRALVMISILNLSKLYFRKSTLLDALFTASLIILLANPGILFDLSFKLSFSAVLGIFAGISMFEKLKSKDTSTESRSLQRFETYKLVSKFKNHIQTSFFAILGIQIVQLPVTIAHFHGFPFIGSAANLLVVPLVAPAIVSGICLIIFVQLNMIKIAFVISKFLRFLLSLIARICIFFSSNFLSYIYLELKGFELFQQLTVLTFFFSVLAFLLLTMKKTKAGKYAFFILLLSTFVFSYLISPNGLILLDVGQGTSVLASIYGMSVIFDGGPPGVNLFEKVLRIGASPPQHIFLSHYHLDHCGGLISIMDTHGFSVSKTLWLPPPKTPLESDLSALFTMVALKNGIEVRNVVGDYRIALCDDRLVVYLFGSGSQLDGMDSNERSDIYLIKFSNKDGKEALFLYPSDCSAEQLERFSRLRLQAVVAPHHGSLTGFSKKFYETFHGMVLISSGKNSYGLPSNELLEYLESRGLHARTTLSEGTIYCQAF